MSLRAKIALALAALAAVAALAIGAVSYRVTARELRSEVDDSLRRAAAEVLAPRPGPGRLDLRTLGRRLDAVGGQVLDGSGEPVATLGIGEPVPVDATDLELAAARERGRTVLRDVEADGQELRALTRSLGEGRGAVQLVRDLGEVERVLRTLLVRIALATGVVSAAGALVGWAVARQVTRRLVRVTEVAEAVAGTGDLTATASVGGTDEAGRLGAAFDRMLGALAASRAQQRRLVQDAGHELRTPLTSLRTNAEVLQRYGELDPATRERVLADLVAETRELGALVDELVQLATELPADEAAEPVHLGSVVERVAARARRRSGKDVLVDTDDTVVTARPAALERAVANLVDNAAKFDPGPDPIEVTVAGGVLTVADRGPGIDAADRPHVFERFYRAASARSAPGSGLGLSIVAEVVAREGGSTFVEERPGGGTRIGFRLPT